MLQFPEALIATLAIFAAVVLTGLIVVAGGWALRLLRLPPEEMLEPPAPPLTLAGDPAAARARAAAWLAAADRARRAGTLAGTVAEADELARWIGSCDRERGLAATAAVAAGRAAADAALAAYKAGDEAALAAAERDGLAAVGAVKAQADGLPDFSAQERRKLLWLLLALVVSLLLAVFSLCLR